MGIKESFEKVIQDGRILAVILLVAILWGIGIILDGEIALWESICSGIALIIFGWVLFTYLYSRSKEVKGWVISKYIYLGMGVCVVVINIYALIYYGLRWYKLLTVEAYLPVDFVFQVVRYILLVVFYCSIIWSAKYVKKIHEGYISRFNEKAVIKLIAPYLYPRVKKLREMSVRELIGTVITDERTLLVIIGLTFLWRTFVGLDFEEALWESICSGIALFLMGWLFFAYIYSQSIKQRDWSDLVKVYHGIALGVLAINVYALVYYGMRWYHLAVLEEEPFVLLEFLFRDASYFAWVIFYCASVVLSKFLKRSYEEYMLLSAEVPRAR